MGGLTGDDGFLEAMGVARAAPTSDEAVASMAAAGIPHGSARRLADMAPVGKLLVDIATDSPMDRLYAVTRKLTVEEAQDVVFAFALSLARIRSAQRG